MSRFLFLIVFFLIGLGVVLHLQVELPFYLQWIGKLPGDVLIRKKGVLIYMPFTTAALFSAAVSVLLSALFGSDK